MNDAPPRVSRTTGVVLDDRGKIPHEQSMLSPRRQRKAQEKAIAEEGEQGAAPEEENAAEPMFLDVAATLKSNNDSRTVLGGYYGLVRSSLPHTVTLSCSIYMCSYSSFLMLC